MKYLLKAKLKLLALGVALLSLIFVTGVLWPLHAPPIKQRPTALFISNVSVVNLESGRIQSGQSILVENGEIISVGPNIRPANAQTLDASGQFAIPGLFDMHVHSIKMSPLLDHPMFIIAGVTAIRDMGGCIGIEDALVACAEEKRAWNRAVGEGRMIGPRYDQITSLAINGGSEIPSEVDRRLGDAGIPRY